MLGLSCTQAPNSLSAGFHEIVPAERLSLLTFQDLRTAILGELRVDACQWQQVAQYESPYSKVRGCSLGMVPLAPALAVCALLCTCEDSLTSTLHPGFAGSPVLLEICRGDLGCREARAAQVDERAFLPASRRLFELAPLPHQQRSWLAGSPPKRQHLQFFSVLARVRDLQSAGLQAHSGVPGLHVWKGLGFAPSSGCVLWMSGTDEPLEMPRRNRSRICSFIPFVFNKCTDSSSSTCHVAT